MENVRGSWSGDWTSNMENKDGMRGSLWNTEHIVRGRGFLTACLQSFSMEIVNVAI